MHHLDVLTHITGGNPAAQQASPPLAAPSGEGDETSQRPSLDRHATDLDALPSGSWELPVRPRNCVGGPFVINQWACNSGPNRRSANPEPDSRQRETRDSEREMQHLFPNNHEHRPNISDHQSQYTLQEMHRP